MPVQFANVSVPVGFRVRIGPQYPFFVVHVELENLGGALDETVNTEARDRKNRRPRP